MNDEKIEEGILLTDDDKFWLKRMQDIVGDSIKSVEEAAKQLVVMITVMEGIYAAVLAFSGIKEIPKGSLIAAVLYALPIFLWLFALFFALMVFKSKRYTYISDSPDHAKQIFEKIVEYKHKMLNCAFVFVTISFIFAAMGIIYWLIQGSKPAITSVPWVVW